jgi:hypothetical protein
MESQIALPNRAVAWLKQQQPHAFDPVGALKVDRWLIRREDFLEQAYILMSHHARRRTMLQVCVYHALMLSRKLSTESLQVEFEGPLESGIGSVRAVGLWAECFGLKGQVECVPQGVHVSFFTDAAALLESWNENRALAAGHGVPMYAPRVVSLLMLLDLIRCRPAGGSATRSHAIVNYCHHGCSCVELSSSLDLIELCAMCVAQDLDVCGPLMCELYPHSLLGASGDDGAIETVSAHTLHACLGICVKPRSNGVRFAGAFL